MHKPYEELDAVRDLSLAPDAVASKSARSLWGKEAWLYYIDILDIVLLNKSAALTITQVKHEASSFKSYNILNHLAPPLYSLLWTARKIKIKLSDC